MSKNTILFPSQDIKYLGWNFELNKIGFNTITNNGKYPELILCALKNVFILKAIVFRYLNDRNSFIKSVINLLTDIILILISYLFKIKVIWILHNVDKETIINYKWISSTRRKLLKIFSDTIIVTDPLLIPYAIEEGFPKHKLDWTCFGPIPFDKEINDSTKSLKNDIINFKQELKVKFPKRNIRLGLCISSPSTKGVHFLHANTLTGKYDEEDFIALVMYGEIPDNGKYLHLEDEYYSNEKILYHKGNNTIQENFLIDEIDFIYRSLNDLSVAYTVYVAASINKPIITHNCGFLQHLILENDIGLVVPFDENYSIKNISDFLDNWDNAKSKNFLMKQNWKVAAKKIAQHI